MSQASRRRRDSEDEEDIFFLSVVCLYLEDLRKQKTSAPYRYREPSDYTKSIWRLDDLSERQCIDDLRYVDTNITMKLHNY
jgi:hypothetical protein